MKIRIKGNSIRYRLTRSDVDLLAKNGKVAEIVHFGLASLEYVLQTSPSENLSASYANNCIIVYFPSGWIEGWIHTDKTGFNQKMNFDDARRCLSIVVEKDFTCLDNVIEDQSDNFPNPLINKDYGHE